LTTAPDATVGSIGRMAYRYVKKIWMAVRRAVGGSGEGRDGVERDVQRV
jgi:hypothetical protein